MSVATAAAAVTAATPATGAAPPAPVTAATSAFTRRGLIDDEVASIDFCTIEGGDGGLGLLVAAHLHEAETLGTSGVAVMTTWADCTVQ